MFKEDSAHQKARTHSAPCSSSTASAPHTHRSASPHTYLYSSVNDHAGGPSAETAAHYRPCLTLWSRGSSPGRRHHVGRGGQPCASAGHGADRSHQGTLATRCSRFLRPSPPATAPAPRSRIRWHPIAALAVARRCIPPCSSAPPRACTRGAVAGFMRRLEWSGVWWWDSLGAGACRPRVGRCCGGATRGQYRELRVPRDGHCLPTRLEPWVPASGSVCVC